MKSVIRGGIIALAAVTLSACSNASDTASSAVSEATTALSSAVESATAAEATSSEVSSSVGADPNNPDITKPLTIVEDPYTEAEIQAGKETIVNFLNAFATGDYTASCLLAVDTGWSSIRAVLGGAELKACADSTAAEVETYNVDYSEFSTSIDQIEITDAGGGFGDVTINGLNQGIQVVKMSDGKIYVDVRTF